MRWCGEKKRWAYKAVRDHLEISFGYSCILAILLKLSPVQQTQSISNSREQCFDRLGTQAVWEGERVRVTPLGQRSLCRQVTQGSCQCWQCRGSLALLSLHCRGSGPSSAHSVGKHWEIPTFLTGQLSSVLPKCDIKKGRGEITLQIKQEQFLIHLYRMCRHKCSFN